MYFKKLIGKKCYLSPIDLADAATYAAWWNDQEVNKYQPNHHVINLEKEKENLGYKVKKHNYSIINLENDELIGDVGMNNHDPVRQTAELGIVIGNKTYWNKGYGEEAIRLLVDYLIKNVHVNSFQLYVYASNIGAIRCYEKVGFKKAGKFRQAAFVQGKFEDLILMDLLAREYKE